MTDLISREEAARLTETFPNMILQTHPANFYRPTTKKDIAAGIRAMPAILPRVAGWKLVPTEPTREMIRAVLDRADDGAWPFNWSFMRTVYKDMIAATPSPASGLEIIVEQQEQLSTPSSEEIYLNKEEGD